MVDPNRNVWISNAPGTGLMNGGLLGPGMLTDQMLTDNKLLDMLDIPGKGRCYVFMAK